MQVAILRSSVRLDNLRIGRHLIVIGKGNERTTHRVDNAKGRIQNGTEEVVVDDVDTLSLSHSSEIAKEVPPRVGEYLSVSRPVPYPVKVYLTKEPTRAPHVAERHHATDGKEQDRVEEEFVASVCLQE